MIKKQIQFLFGAIVMLFVMVMIILDSEGTSAAIYQSLMACVDIIIPSLFAFTAICSFIMSTNLYTLLFKPLTFILCPLLHMNQTELSIFLLSMIGGYPVGAKLIHEAINSNKLTETAAKRLSLICYGSGPSFIMGVVGVGIFGSVEIGLVLFVSQLISSLIMAFFINSKVKSAKTTQALPITVTSDNLINAIISTGKTLYIICVMIISFSVVIHFIGYLPLFELSAFFGWDFSSVKAILFSFIEISNIRNFEYNMILLPTISALLSFGGICVIMQIKGIYGILLNIKKFIITRFLTCILSFLSTLLYVILYNPVLDVINADKPYFVSDNSNRYLPAICVLLMGIMLLSLIFDKKQG